MSIKKKAVLFLILANVIWGAAFPIYKWALEVIDPLTFAFLRFFIAAVIILPFVYKNLRIFKKDIPLLILISVISITLQITFLFEGLKLSPSINAPIILSSGPIILIIASALFLKDSIKLKLLAGTLISLLGVITIMFRPTSGSIESDLILGNIFLLLTVLCSVTEALVLKKIMPDYEPISIVFWTFLIGSLPLLIASLLFTPHFLNFSFLDIRVITGLGYAIFLSSIIGYYLYYFGIKYIKASEIGIFSYVDPIATILVAVPLLSEKVTLTYLFGAFLVFFGIFIAEGRIHYHPIGKLFEKEQKPTLLN